MRHTILSVIAALIIVSTTPFVLSYETATGIMNQPLGDFTVPSWIKSNAGWWADDQIDDSSFVSGLQWLISNDIIILPAVEQGTVDDENIIPGWIKNTAGWWADDQIHDITFVAAIKYLIGEGIIIIEQETEVEVVEEPVEVEEVKEFHMIVNDGNCCLNWAHVGEEYRFQIKTFDEFRGSPIDGVTINAKIISKDGELRHNFGTITTEDGIYQNSITIPSMDWYAGNILSVSAEHNGIEKTIEKEFEVFKKSSSSGISGSGNYGKKMFIAGNQSDGILEYTLTTSWDVSTASFVNSFSIASEDDFPSGVSFSNNGKKMFVVGNQNDSVYEYTLTTAWDVSSASYVDSFSVASQGTSSSDLTFSNSGKKMFVTDNGGGGATDGLVNEYELATAWDISTASFVVTLDITNKEIYPTGIAFSNSGKKMFVLGANGDDVNEYTLTTAFDISTASHVDSFSVKSQDAGPNGIAFSNSGKKMFIAGNDGDDVNEYTLTTSWDVSTASFVDSFSIANQETAPNGMFL